MSFLSKTTLLIAIGMGVTSGLIAQVAKHPKTICNPVNLSYRFALDGDSRREAADPTMITYKSEYYLFASKSGGYFHSKDLKTWDLITTADLPLEDYAPAAMVIGDTLYFMASADAHLKIYKTGNPKSGKWTVANPSFPIGMIDPDLFADDEGRVYFYYGCSNSKPLYAVELDRKTLNPIGKPVEVLNSDKKNHGWERSGDYNDQPESPWIEGSWMTKHNGKYYLQYAAPGTQFKSYCDGLYVADKPLGPFKLAVNNPVSYKPEGFVAGAGHSSTFKDKYGNYWHVSTMTISVKHMFERRLGLFPTFFDKAGNFHVYTGFGDFPMVVPNKKINGPDELFPGWMLLSYQKPITVSSSQPNHPANFAGDEEIRTYWSAASGNKGEWMSMDLGKLSRVNAVQINYAENDTKLHGRADNIYYQYLLEYSSDNKTWRTLANKTTTKTDVPHDYIELDKAVTARYIRLINYHVPDGTFAIADLRVFGKGNGKALPASTNFEVDRSGDDRCVVNLKWPKAAGVTGYNVRYGTEKNKLYQNYQVLGSDHLTIRSLDAGEKYYFTIDAFNENGIVKGNRVKEVK